MSEGTCPVQWTGLQAVVTLPQHIDSRNAGQVREQLLQVMNSGAVVLIADLADTVSCDYSGADAVARAYQHAVASGTDLRLVVAADVVRRALSVNGLHRLIPVYPTLDAALAGGRTGFELPGAASTAAITSASPRGRPPACVPAADPADRTGELLDRVVSDIFGAAMSLQDAADLPRDVIAERISDCLCRLNDAVRQIRDHVFASQSEAGQPAPASSRLPEVYERAVAAAQQTVLLRQRLAQTARALRAAAAQAAALLDQRSDLVSEPSPIDYPTNIKQWQVIADQAEEMAERWERRALSQGRT